MVDSVQVEVSSEILLVVDAVIRVVRHLKYWSVSTSEKLPGLEVDAPYHERSQWNLSFLHGLNVHLQCTNSNMFISCDNSG